MRILTALAVTCILSACSNPLNPGYIPLEHSQDGFLNPDARNLHKQLVALTPARRLIEGMNIANVRCDKFFEDLDRRQALTEFGSNRLTNLSAILPALLQQSGVNEKAVANILAAIGFADGWLEDKKTLFLLTEFKNNVYNNWQQTKRATQQNNLHVALYLQGLVSTTGNVDQDRLLGNKELADSIVNTMLYEYSRLCLRSQLKKYLYDHAEKPVVPGQPPANGIPPVAGAPVVPPSDNGLLTETPGARSSRRFTKTRGAAPTSALLPPVFYGK